MKKTLWLVLVLILVCVLTLSACDKGADQTQNLDTNQSTNQPSDNNGESTNTDDTQTPSTDNTECQHTFGDWITITEATCKEGGEAKHICSQCSSEEKKAIDKTNNHTEVIDVATESTCKVNGKTEGKHCSVCNTVIIKQTDTAIIDHNYQSGACTMCKAVDTAAKQAEIDAENKRHENRLAEIEEYYPSVISGLQERVDNLKEANGISYVYNDSYCYDRISSLTSEIRTLERKIASLSGSTNSSDVAERRRYEAQLTQKQNEQNMYYKCITINGLNDEITNTRTYYLEAIADENTLHGNNLESIEIKYTCASNGHTVVIDEEKKLLVLLMDVQKEAIALYVMLFW